MIESEGAFTSQVNWTGEPLWTIISCSGGFVKTRRGEKFKLKLATYLTYQQQCRYYVQRQLHLSMRTFQCCWRRVTWCEVHKSGCLVGGPLSCSHLIMQRYTLLWHKLHGAHRNLLYIPSFSTWLYWYTSMSEHDPFSPSSSVIHCWMWFAYATSTRIPSLYHLWLVNKPIAER